MFSGNKQKIKKTLGQKQIANMFEERKLSDYVKNKIKQYNFTYEDLDEDNRDFYLRKIVDVLLDKKIEYSGKHRIAQWEKGWSQNLNELTKKDKAEAITPHYFGKYPVIRIRQRYIKTLSRNFERNSLYLIQNWLFDKYMRKAGNIYEFGCGTGHNLLLAREVNPHANIWGLDWASSSQKIIKKLAKNIPDKKLFAGRFNFFSPDKKFILAQNTVIYTVAALEQTGKNFKKFFKYLSSQKNRPKLCIHIEPVAELLDENNLMDYLSVRYFEKRKYLFGFLTFLRKMEKEGKIKILKQQRSYIGSLFIDGYSIIVWSFKDKK